MKYTANKNNKANATVKATFSKELLDANLEKVAKVAAKSTNISGFRKGKAPLAVVKARFGEKLEQDAQGEALRVLLDKTTKELEIDPKNIIGEPSITVFDKKENGSIEIEVKIAIKPEVILGDYKSFAPAVEAKEISESEINDRLEQMAKNSAPLATITEKRALEKDDYSIIDFEGFVDGVAFEGGSAKNYSLKIGSGSFIPGFEEQMIGMNIGETKEVNVKFPESYGSADLAGKDAMFKVTLHEIQAKTAAVIDDNFAKTMLRDEKNGSLEALKAKIKEQIKGEKMSKYYNEELKPAYLDALVKSMEFDLPEVVVEQEIAYALNNKIRAMNPEELEELKADKTKVDAMREEAKPTAIDSVKATFIVDALAKAENVDVNDNEVMQVLYFEAIQMGQNPQELIKYYQESGYLPAIKMSMIEDKVFTKILDEKLK
jgi:trigger factor